MTISLAGFCTDLTMGSAWATCQDIGQRYAAIVAGFMNMIGNLGGAAANWIFGFVLERSLAAHARAGRRRGIAPAPRRRWAWSRLPDQFRSSPPNVVDWALCWLRIDATRPIAAEEQN